MLKKNTKLNFRLSDIIQAGLGIAKVDGGFVIAIQIINFLLIYFSAYFSAGTENIQNIAGLNKSSLIIAIITMLNLAAIIYRITGLTRGIKYSAAICYQQALRRGPTLLMLYLLGSAVMLIFAIPLMRVVQNQNLLIFLMLSLIPIGILCCIHVVDQQKNAIQAITATFKIITDKISVNLLINLALIYSLPFCLGTMFATPNVIMPYISLFHTIWFLFCHILTIVIYAGASVKVENNATSGKATKVIII